jgi:hypothetical protein
MTDMRRMCKKVSVKEMAQEVIELILINLMDSESDGSDTYDGLY